jgi:hypothetical protein
MSAVSVQPLRPEEMLAKPVWIDPAYDNPGRLMDLVRASAPHRMSAAVHKKDEDGRDVPWFRIFWAAGTKLLDERAREFFYNERFVEAAKESFDAKVIIPNALMTNHHAPMAGGPPHLDLPFFRSQRAYPFWLLVSMAYSGLFHRWAIPIASTIVWFYRGAGGDLEYWLDGPDAPSKLVHPPLWNVGVVSDNEYMWHRVGPIGEQDERMAPGTIRRDAQLHAQADNSWRITDSAGFDRHFKQDQIRHSFLWKAYAFADERAHREFLDHSNDLTDQQIISVFNADLKQRDIEPVECSDPVADQAWKKLIQQNYKARKVYGAQTAGGY